MALLAFLVTSEVKAQAKSRETPGEIALRRVAVPFLSLDSFRAEFVQTQFWVGMEDSTVSRGRLLLKRPNRFRIEYREPKGHLQVSDGRSVWTYVPEHREVLLARLPEGSGGDLLRRILEESRPDAEVLRGVIDKRPAEILLLRPPEELGLVQVRLWTDPSANAILQYEIEDVSGNRSLYRLTRTEANPPLEESLFAFRAPEGVPVVEVGSP